MANMSKSEREAFLAQPHVGVISIEADDRGPVTVPIWYSYEPGGHVKVLTGVNSQKTRLLQAAGRFTICVQRERLPYKYVSVEGPIVESRPAELERDSRPMARRYLGPSMGDQYVEDGDDDSIAFSMEPQRWSSVDYGGAE
ncbi:MAG: pyridoxamine 5'-phosphate oxidase family protein [Acidimicrobiales bacterium]